MQILHFSHGLYSGNVNVKHLITLVGRGGYRGQAGGAGGVTVFFLLKKGGGMTAAA